MTDSPQEQKVKILVVDDEPTIRSVVKALLDDAGYQVLEASNGEEALPLALKERPGLILLDLIMPKTNGFEFLQTIRNNTLTRNIPIVLLSVLVSGTDVDTYINDLDVAGSIDKTEMVTSLIPRVKEILSKQAHRAA